jgi:hypothetical protein
MPTKKQPAITGPSSDPKPPVVTTGSVAAPVIRTGVQGIGAGWIVDGIDIWNVAHLSDRQQVWLLVGLTALLSFAQNMVEKRAGRRLIGAAS